MRALISVSDKTGIVDFAKACEAKTVVVYHTDATNARPHLVTELETAGHIVHQPQNGVSEILLPF